MTSMVTTKHRLGFIAAVTVTVALGCYTSGQAQTAAAPPTAAPAASTAPQPQSAAPPAATANKPTSHHRFVENVQTTLNANGAKLTVDGRTGPKTVAALRAYQHEHNLKVTGRPDRATLKALGI